MQELISVIIPTYNRGYILPEAIDSLFKQTWRNWEVIIVDDGSIDNTKELITQYRNEPRIKYIYLENSGAANARNVGASNANGRWLTFLDSDDLASEKWLEVLHDTLGEASIACCAVRQITPTSTRIRPPVKLGAAFHNYTMRFTNGGSYLIEKRIFDAVGGFDPLVRAGQHTELGIRVAHHCYLNHLQISNVNQPLIDVRHDRDDHIRQNTESTYLGTTYFLEKHKEHLNRDPHLKHLYNTIAIHRGINRPFYEIAGYFGEAIKIKPLALKPYYHFMKYLFSYISKR